MQKIKNVKTHYHQFKRERRVIQRGGRNKRAFAAEDVTHAVFFLRRYAERESMSLPGRVPGYRSITDVHKSYADACTSAGNCLIYANNLFPAFIFFL